jgi:hypothetical protein
MLSWGTEEHDPNLLACLAHMYTLKTEAAGSSRKLVTVYQKTVVFIETAVTASNLACALS